LSSDFENQAKGINGRFKGDPSYLLDGGAPEEEPVPEENNNEENIKVERFREIHRLTYTIGVSLSLSVVVVAVAVVVPMVIAEGTVAAVAEHLPPVCHQHCNYDLIAWLCTKS